MVHTTNKRYIRHKKGIQHIQNYIHKNKDKGHLLGVQVGRGLIDEVDVCGFPKGECYRHALQLSAREILNLVVDDVGDAQRFHHVRHELPKK